VLRAALMKFVPFNLAGQCLARHNGGMEGSLIKVIFQYMWII
jgi:hypothetical protein